MIASSSLPPSWELTSIGEVCSYPQYGYTTKASETGKLKFLRTTDITSGQIDWSTVPYCAEDPDDPKKYLLEDGDVVISRAGSVGFSYLLKKPQRSVFASYLIRFRPLIDPVFFSYFLLSPFYWTEIAEHKVGIAVGNVNASKLREIPFTLPPLAEQRRIVTKIEELFSELDKGIETLKTAKAQLSVYRQAILKDAFEGKLTAEWRSKHADQLETVDQILSRIRAVRRSKCAARGKYTEPPEIDPAELPEIPAEWPWVRLDLIGVVGSGMSVSKDRQLEDPVEVPYLRVANVQRGHLDLTEIKTMKIERVALDELKLQPGDILFNEGGDRDKLGRGWIWEGQIDPCITQNHVFRVTPIDAEIIDPLFVSHWGNSFGQQFFLRNGKQTTNLASINKSVLSSLPVPIPSITEQRKIVEHVEELNSSIGYLESDIETNLQKAEALRQSILKKAFAGELVPQDPSDEPASLLLERIRAERAENTPRASSIKPKTRGRKPRPATT